MNSSPDDELWENILAFDREYATRVISQWLKISDKIGVLDAALKSPRNRQAALRLLITLDEETKRNLFGTLVDLASVGHSDVSLCRNTICSIDRRWVLDHIEPVINAILANATDEEYRRLAELCVILDKSALKNVVVQALASRNPHIHEVGVDFCLYL